MREKYIDSWFSLLREADPAYGVPLVVAGLVLMFIGWQLHKVAVPLIFLLVGIIAGIVFFESLTARLIAGGVLGIGLAIVSNFEMRYSVAVLGGIVTAFAVSAYLTTFPAVMTQTMILWVAAGVSFMGGAAISFVMFREMAVVVTSFVGALLLVSGLTAVMPQTMPNLYRTISTFIGDYPAFLVPFMIGGPTVIAVLVQLAGANRSDAAAT